MGVSGNDVLEGGSGADSLEGGDGVDTASYLGSAAAVTIDLGANSASGGDATGDTYTSIENVKGSGFDDVLSGDAFGNVLEGDGGADTLFGADGEDTLLGGGGTDQLRGSEGADSLDGGSGFDTADYSASTTGVTVNLQLGTGFGGLAEGDLLTDVDALVGSGFNDVLVGNIGVNTLTGGAGDDVRQPRRRISPCGGS